MRLLRTELRTSVEQTVSALNHLAISSAPCVLTSFIYLGFFRFCFLRQGFSALNLETGLPLPPECWEDFKNKNQKTVKPHIPLVTHNARSG